MNLRIPLKLGIPLTLTRTGLCFAGLLCLLYLSSIQSKSGLLFLIIGILLGCYAANAVAALRSVRNLSVGNPSLKGVFEGGRAGFWLTVGNRSPRPIGMFEASWDGDPAIFKAASMPPLSEERLRAEAVFHRRGTRRLSGLSIRSTFPFGLVRATGRFDGKGELLVYPTIYPCEPPPTAGLEPVVGGSRRCGLKARAGFEFSGVRPYAGDVPLRSIHWKSSSKGLGLMVKEFDEELAGRVTIMLDSLAVRTPDGSPALDWAARAAASLALAALREGDCVELLDVRSLRIHRSPQLAGCDVILDALAVLAETTEPLQPTTLEKAVAAAQPRSALAVILTKADEEALTVLEGLRRPGRLAVYAPEFMPIPDDRLPNAIVFHYGAFSMSRRKRGEA